MSLNIISGKSGTMTKLPAIVPTILFPTGCLKLLLCTDSAVGEQHGPVILVVVQLVPRSFQTQTCQEFLFLAFHSVRF